MNLFDQIVFGKKDPNQVEIQDNTNLVTEAVYPDQMPYLKVNTKLITLPKGVPTGNGNICFLYSHNIDESISVITESSNFMNGNHYFYYFIPVNYKGKLYNKLYNIRFLEERKNIYDMIEKKTSIHPYIRLTLSENDKKNMYFDLHEYVNIYQSTCEKLTPQKQMVIYWTFFKSIFQKVYTGYQSKFVLVNLDNWPLGKDLRENMKSPLFMIYYTLFKNFALLQDMDIDFLFYAGKKSLKVNPSHCDDKSYRILRIEMKKLYDGISTVDIDKITDDNEIKKLDATSKVSESITKAAIPEVTKSTVAPEEKSTEKVKTAPVTPENSKDEKSDQLQKKVEDIAKASAEKIDPTNLTEEEIRDKVTANTEAELNNNKELLEDIYTNMMAQRMPTKPVSNARDKLLQENQYKIKVGNLTVKDIRSSNKSKQFVPTRTISNKLNTINKDMKQVRYDNFDKKYTEDVMPEDIMNAFLSLNKKSIPMYIRDVKVEDTSDELNYKETYTVLLEDGNRQRHTIKIDIPKFIDDKFLWLGGNKKLIKKQSFLFPVVKCTPDTVQIVTNYNKMFIKRVDSKSTGNIERLKKLLKENDDVKKYFTIGNVYTFNFKYITTIEYDDMSKQFTEFKHGKTHIIFNQQKAERYREDHGIKEKSGYMFIGMASNDKPLYINNETQRTDDDKYIVDLIIDTYDDSVKTAFEKIKLPKRLMYAKVTVMGQAIIVAMLICFWEGLSTVMKKMNVEFRLEDKLPTTIPPSEAYIRFADCYMIYKDTVPVSLIMNGLRIFSTDKYKITDFDTQEPYIDYFVKVYGKQNISNALMEFYESTIDPITLEILNDLNLPTDLVQLIYYAVSLLADSQHPLEIDPSLSRIRGAEIVPAILYYELASNYINFKNANGRKKFSIPRDAVIKELLSVKTVEDYSTLNPYSEMDACHSVSTKGFRGVNLDDAYTLEKRSYVPEMTGIISPSASPDGSVGVSKTLSLEPNITTMRGYVEIKNDKPDELQDVNLFSPCEMSMPVTAYIDDPTRLGHAVKQSKHVIPVQKASPVLIANGFDEVARFHLSSDFVINADEDGVIEDYDPKSNIMIVKYKSGKCRAINLNGNIVKNGGGGFFLSNILKTDLKVGDKVKKDDVIAYHKDFFTNDQFNHCRMNMGTLAKVALMSTYNTYEDATFITEKLAKDCTTEMSFLKQVVIGKNSNVEYIIKKGEHINVGDSLIQFDTSYEDSSLNELLANLSDDNSKSVLAGSRNNVPSKYAGVIEDIRIYCSVPTDQLSESLRKIVNSYYNSIKEKNKFLEKYDPESKDSVVKCGVLCTETSKPVKPDRYGNIKGQKVIDSVLIEFYVKHPEPLEIGSKIANFSALKNTIGEIIPAGYEPYSEFRPDEEISTMIASNSILKRMTPSVILTTLANKNIIELKRKLKEIYES